MSNLEHLEQVYYAVSLYSEFTVQCVAHSIMSGVVQDTVYKMHNTSQDIHNMAKIWPYFVYTSTGNSIVNQGLFSFDNSEKFGNP